MGQTYDTDLGARAMSAQDLDAVAQDRAGAIGSIGYGHACRDHSVEDVELPGGWRARWIDRRGMGNHGTLVLVPTDARTRALLREGKVRAYQAAGLSRAQAEALHACRASYKMELAPALARVLADPALTGAMVAHPGKCGPGSGRARWLAFYAGAARSPELRDLSAPREAELARMVWACVASAAEAA
jgi:hypothetical protein